MRRTHTKECAKCGETKELIFFGKNSKSKDGFQKRCKVCRYNTNSAIRGAIRRCYSRSPYAQIAKERVRIERVKYKKDGTPSKVPDVFYKCAVCDGEFKSKDIQVEHIEPVIPTDGTFSDWNTFVERMFVDEDGLQILCKPCHNEKTQYERKIRNENLK